MHPALYGVLASRGEVVDGWGEEAMPQFLDEVEIVEELGDPTELDDQQNILPQADENLLSPQESQFEVEMDGVIVPENDVLDTEAAAFESDAGERIEKIVLFCTIQGLRKLE